MFRPSLIFRGSPQPGTRQAKAAPCHFRSSRLLPFRREALCQKCGRCVKENRESMLPGANCRNSAAGEIENGIPADAELTGVGVGLV